MTSVGTVQAAALFTNGDASIRVVRILSPDGRFQLVITGPRSALSVEAFEDAIACATREMELQREFSAQGFARAPMHDRRARAR